MTNNSDSADGIDLYVQITELPTTTTHGPQLGQRPEDLADTGSEPWILVVALAIVALGAVLSKSTRRRAARHR